MTPLERLRAHPMPFAEALGMQYLSAGVDEVVGRMVVRPELCTLGAAAAFLNLTEGAKGATTLNSQTQLVAAAPVGTILIARSAPIRRGRRTQVWQTRVETADGKLIAVTTQTQMTL